MIIVDEIFGEDRRNSPSERALPADDFLCRRNGGGARRLRVFDLLFRQPKHVAVFRQNVEAQAMRCSLRGGSAFSNRHLAFCNEDRKSADIYVLSSLVLHKKTCSVAPMGLFASWFENPRLAPWAQDCIARFAS